MYVPNLLQTGKILDSTDYKNMCRQEINPLPHNATF